MCKCHSKSIVIFPWIATVSPIFIFSSCFCILSLSAGQQCSGSTALDSLYPWAGSGCSWAPGVFDLGLGGIPQQKGGGPVLSGLWEARPAGAGRSNGIHSRAAERDGCTLLCAGCENNTQQVRDSAIFIRSICYLYLNFLKFLLLSYFSRLVKAIENLQCFSLAAEPSFRHFHLDASKEIKIINNLDFIQGGLSASLFLQYMVC